VSAGSTSGRLAWAAAGFGLAAALSSWNPRAAPFGLVVGLASVVLAIRALRRGVRRPVAAAGLALAVLAVAASGVVLAVSAGLGREPGGEAVVPAPPPAEVARELDAAAARSKEARERARSELRAVDGAPAPPPAGPKR
jgi:hypothetical protein